MVGSATKPKKQPPDLAEKFRRCLAARDKGKKFYQRADRLLEELMAEIEPGRIVQLNDSGKSAVIVDRFKVKSIVFQPVGCRRYEIEVSDN